jgi:hypothetical protein
MSFLSRLADYLGDQTEDAIRFIAIAGALGMVPETDDEARELGQLAAQWAAKHGTPTRERVQEVIDREH